MLFSLTAPHLSNYFHTQLELSQPQPPSIISIPAGLQETEENVEKEELKSVEENGTCESTMGTASPS